MSEQIEDRSWATDREIVSDDNLDGAIWEETKEEDRLWNVLGDAPERWFLINSIEESC